jgi:2-dehydropantoate 2-reductase
MRHAILGAGGVGGLIGAVLAKYGDHVTLVVRPEKLQAHPRELSLQSTFGKFTVPVSVIGEVMDPFDILWVTTKATQLEAALGSIRSAAGIHTVVPLLNGVDHVQLLRERFGHDRVVPATISVESERVAPGQIVHRSPFVRFNAASIGQHALEPVVQKFTKFGFECKFIDNEATLLWSKLVFLAPLALSGTAAGTPIGLIKENPDTNAKLEEAVREVGSVATASGATVDVEGVLNVIRNLPGAMQSSMQKDVAAGRQPELDAISGPILRGAEVHGIKVPVITEYVAEIKARLREHPLA